MITTEAYTHLPAFAPDAIYPYGSDPNQCANLYLPRPAPSHPVVVLAHGGCWGARYDAKPLGGLCRALTGVGYAVWNLEYRRNGNGGGYPQTMLDVAEATDLLRTAADEHPLDLNRVVAMGHSAGGQIALWLAARRKLAPDSPLYSADPLPIIGVVCLAGIPDLAGAVAQGVCGGEIPRLMGGRPEQVPDHYRQASPMALLPLGIRQIHVIGDSDDNIINVRPYVAAAQQAGDEVELMIVPDAGHFEIVAPTPAAWPFVYNAVTALVD